MDDNKYGYPYGGSPFAPRGSGGYPQPFGQPPRPAYPPQPRQNPAQSPQKPAAETLLDGTQILTGEGFKPPPPSSRRIPPAPARAGRNPRLQSRPPAP